MQVREGEGEGADGVVWGCCCACGSRVVGLLCRWEGEGVGVWSRAGNTCAWWFECKGELLGSGRELLGRHAFGWHAPTSALALGAKALGV